MLNPESDLQAIVSDVCPDCGHWPYTKESELFVGWRPSEDGPFTFARNTPQRVTVSFDLVICCARHRLGDSETLRFMLYQALRDGGWRLNGIPGPETYVAQTRMFMWPFTVSKGFALDEAGMPAGV